ncbi:hypothetical protein GCM10020367_08110 [Streptomyces sannanensis]|uniref:Uncharacterized protein n=1 Tax=Streptomyces sannanensis TaxID=285536 RepID=A0ABP6S5E9_9ACTN
MDAVRLPWGDSMVNEICADMLLLPVCGDGGTGFTFGHPVSNSYRRVASDSEACSPTGRAYFARRISRLKSV